MQVERARGFVNVRFWGAFMAAKYGSPNIRPGGSITLTNGIAGLRPRKGWTVAASICGAMEALTRALAVELAPIREGAGERFHRAANARGHRPALRSEEHTSELQSLRHLVCRLLLEN